MAGYWRIFRYPTPYPTGYCWAAGVFWQVGSYWGRNARRGGPFSRHISQSADNIQIICRLYSASKFRDIKRAAAQTEPQPQSHSIVKAIKTLSKIALATSNFLAGRRLNRSIRSCNSGFTGSEISRPSNAPKSSRSAGIDRAVQVFRKVFRETPTEPHSMAETC